jgi:hypothetical protein
VLAWHPLLLPCLLTNNHQDILNEETQSLWEQLINVETVSGQTGAPAVDSFISEEVPFTDTMKGILGVVQLTAAWQSHGNGVLLTVNAIEKFLYQVHTMTPKLRKKKVNAVNNMLLEYIQLLAQRTKVTMGDLQYINNRGQAQTGAVSLSFFKAFLYDTWANAGVPIADI